MQSHRDAASLEVKVGWTMPREIRLQEPSRRFKSDDGLAFDMELASLRLIIKPLQQILDKIEKSKDPESYGYFDTGEYLVGVAMVGVQKYLASSCKAEGVSKDIGLRLGPQNESGEFVAALLNTLANAWKHHDEWDWAERPAPTRAERKKAQQRDDTASIFDLLKDSELWWPFTNVSHNVLGDLETNRLESVLSQWRDALEVEGDKQRAETTRLVQEAVAGHLDGLVAAAPSSLDREQLAKLLGTSTGILDRLRREGCPMTPLSDVISWLQGEKDYEHRLRVVIFHAKPRTGGPYFAD